MTDIQLLKRCQLVLKAQLAGFDTAQKDLIQLAEDVGDYLQTHEVPFTPKEESHG